MIFKIIKKGASNFWHVFNNGAKEVNISDFEVVLDSVAQTYNVQLLNGANIPNTSVAIANIVVIDETDVSIEETFATVELLRLRLVELGYNPYLGAGNADSITGLINAGTNVTITGLGTLASPYIISSSGGSGTTPTLQEVTDAGDTTTNLIEANGGISVGDIMTDGVQYGITPYFGFIAEDGTSDVLIGATGIVVTKGTISFGNDVSQATFDTNGFTSNNQLYLPNENQSILQSLIFKGTNFTATTGVKYITMSLSTITDPSPLPFYYLNFYSVFVASGTTTIGGVGYTAGALVYRFYDGSSWISKDYGAGGGGATNLGYTPSATNGIVTSDTGTDATIPLADATNAGLLKPAKFTVLENTTGTNSGDNATNTQYSGLDASKENTSNKTGTFLGNETSTSFFLHIKGLVDALKDNLGSIIPAKATALVDTDRLIIFSSGLTLTRTWEQVKTTLANTFALKADVTDCVVLASPISTTSLTAVDTNLKHAISANQELFFECMLSATAGASGIKYQITVPTGATVIGVYLSPNTNSASIRYSSLVANNLTLAVQTFNSTSGAILQFLVKNSTTAGDVIVSFAVGSAGTATIEAGSSLVKNKTRPV